MLLLCTRCREGVVETRGVAKSLRSDDGEKRKMQLIVFRVFFEIFQ